MCRCRMGNPKKSSRFICLKCLDWKFTYIQGIQRSHQREKGHIKDLYCLKCQSVTKNLEIRWCDGLDEMMEYAEELHKEYYERAV